MNTKPLLILAAMLAFASSTATAQSGRRGPPPEAIEACQGLDEGEACSFAGRRGETLEGTCEAPPEAESLACRPAGAPEGGGRR